MLFVSLALSAVLLWAANRAVRRSRSPAGEILGWGAGCSAGPAIFFMPLGVALQTLLLLVGYAVWRWAGLGPRAFLRLSVAATMLAYAVVIGWAVKHHQDNTRLRELFPLESIEARLPETRTALPAEPLPAASLERLGRFEDAVARLEDVIPGEGRRGATFFLRALHNDAVLLFINSPGFGLSRMPWPEEGRITYGRRT